MFSNFKNRLRDYIDTTQEEKSLEYQVYVST